MALGGGHGLYASLSALRTITPHLTAIVTVADDGGSSGRLRGELGIVPPGDLRMALSALCEDTEWGRTWRDVLQTRFSTDGPLDGHALGNLLIATLWERTGDVVEGLDWVARLLRCVGRVLPLAQEPLDVHATMIHDGHRTEVSGQQAVATAPGRVEDFRVLPLSPHVPQETIEAIDAAEMVVLGPGSWYTSVLTHFMVEPVREALLRARQRTVLTLNIAHEDPETAGTGRVDDIEALRGLVPEFRPAMVIADASHASDQGLAEVVHEWGTELTVTPLAASGAVDRHDVVLLAAQYAHAARQLAPSAGQQQRWMAG
ncbi:MAG: uridine diphosphate-N-acetylglucosamine-binding protein YvcK [Demequina sp.]